MRSQVFLGATVIVGTLLLILYGISSLSSIEPPTNVNQAEQQLTALDHPTFSFGNPVRGPVEAPFTIFEFGDYGCAPCADIEPAVAQALKDFPGKVRIVWKDMPNAQLHPEASAAAQAARCAQQQGAFWEAHDLLLANQEKLGPTTYEAIAAELKLDSAEFKACLEQETTKPIVERDLEEAIRLNIDATPFLFVGTRRVSGIVSPEQLNDLIEQEMKPAAGG
ncbi:thioredoxin domain-containing protein [Candidatus Uhrbacteria bacterium]|nr:thioredoxin domain-containing protein [Candidatus Uhrbacteria bacterium]